MMFLRNCERESCVPARTSFFISLRWSLNLFSLR